MPTKDQIFDTRLNFRTASTDRQAGELMQRAIHGKGASREETLCMYANRRNWRKELHPNPEHGVMWVWQGPMTCAFEAAEVSLDSNKP